MANTIDLGNVRGLQGERGATGDRGPQGIQGPKGDTGATGAAGTTTWAGITGKPGTFPPSGHTHPASQITGIGRSITFAPNAMRVSSTTQIRLDGTLNSAMCDKDDTLATIQSDGTVLIKKAGRYLIHANVYFYYSAAIFIQIEYKNPGATGWRVLHRTIATVELDTTTADLSCVRKLPENTVFRLATQSVIPHTNKPEETHLEFVFLGE